MRQLSERRRRQHLSVGSRVQGHLLQDRTLVQDQLRRRGHPHRVESSLEVDRRFSGTLSSDAESIHRRRYFAQTGDRRTGSLSGQDCRGIRRRIVFPKGRDLQAASSPHLSSPLLATGCGLR